MVDSSIQSIDLMDLTRGTENIYKSVAIIGLRANQISSQMRQELQSKLAEFGTVGDSSLEEIVENREQIEIARHYEQLPKPTLIALDEFFRDKIYFRDLDAPQQP